MSKQKIPQIEELPKLRELIKLAVADVKAVTKIKLADLTKSLIDVPSLYIKVSEVGWKIEANYTNLYNRRKTLQLELGELVRATPKEYIPGFVGGRVTNAMIDEQVAQFPSYIGAKEAELIYDNLKLKVGDLKATLEYVSRSLSRLESLHGQQYWSK